VRTIAIANDERQRTLTDDALQVRSAEAEPANLVAWVRDEEATQARYSSCGPPVQQQVQQPTRATTAWAGIRTHAGLRRMKPSSGVRAYAASCSAVILGTGTPSSFQRNTTGSSPEQQEAMRAGTFEATMAVCKQGFAWAILLTLGANKQTRTAADFAGIGHGRYGGQQARPSATEDPGRP
jgi:hypothetical protein